MRCFYSAQARLHRYTGSAQPGQPRACNQRIGVDHGRHHAAYASGYQRFTTRASAALVATGLQGDVSGCALRGVATR